MLVAQKIPGRYPKDIRKIPSRGAQPAEGGLEEMTLNLFTSACVNASAMSINLYFAYMSHATGIVDVC